ncbi:MAG: hypothetical protein FJ271_05220 [Planctomycetes bacterium]|nr:hypothetical protein [Planctomycetota bacterium]
MQDFTLIGADSTAELLHRLERFLEWWYGPGRPEYGDSADLTKRTLPFPLRRFYAFAGRWPSREPECMPYLYSGAGGHHLLPLDELNSTADGKLRFFMEYQGDWDGVD